ncbi:hypothetical protein ACF1AE_27525 [Streptomyces sp. NPDC014986]|uniref:hypothetical protein n=1 Tax=Streptomyces sp. NPDC014986 TaxID=3364934 RepID=UPI00370357DC
MTGGAAVRPATGDGDDTAADDGPGLARPAGGAAPVAPGRLVTVRNRPWVVTEVTRSALTTDDPARSAGASAPHLVSLASVEDGARDEEPRVVWELEQATGVHDRYELPSPDAGRIGRTGVLHAELLAADRHTACWAVRIRPIADCRTTSRWAWSSVIRRWWNPWSITSVGSSAPGAR